MTTWPLPLGAAPCSSVTSVAPFSTKDEPPPPPPPRPAIRPPHRRLPRSSHRRRPRRLHQEDTGRSRGLRHLRRHCRAPQGHRSGRHRNCRSCRFRQHHQCRRHRLTSANLQPRRRRLPARGRSDQFRPSFRLLALPARHCLRPSRILRHRHQRQERGCSAHCHPRGRLKHRRRHHRSCHMNCRIRNYRNLPNRRRYSRRSRARGRRARVCPYEDPKQLAGFNADRRL